MIFIDSFWKENGDFSFNFANMLLRVATLSLVLCCSVYGNLHAFINLFNNFNSRNDS